MDWAFWFYWIMATTLGWVFGDLFFGGIPVIISGAFIAALQWAVLYKRIQKAWRWALVSSAAWIIGFILLTILFPGSFELFAGLILGGVVGIAQWFILRNEVDWSGWWIVISIMAWITGLNLMPGLLTSGALPGALTGLTLMILFRFSSRNEQNVKGEKYRRHHG